MTAAAHEAGWASPVLEMEEVVDPRGRLERTLVRDGEGREVGQVVPAPRSSGTRSLLALTQASSVVAERYEVVDNTGTAVWRLRRPAPVFTPTLVVHGADGLEMGRIITSVGGWGTARLESPLGAVGALRAASPSPEVYVVLDQGSREIARIQVEPQPADPQAQPTARCWRLTRGGDPEEPLRSLALIAGLTPDLILVDPGRGIV